MLLISAFSQMVERHISLSLLERRVLRSVNSAPDCAKHRAMQAHPYVSMAIIDPENPFRYIAMHGPVIEMTEDGAREHNDRLAKRYLGFEKFPGPADEVRMTCTIAIAHVAIKG